MNIKNLFDKIIGEDEYEGFEDEEMVEMIETSHKKCVLQYFATRPFLIFSVQKLRKPAAKAL